jgi:hypothetical protein
MGEAKRKRELAKRAETERAAEELRVAIEPPAKPLNRKRDREMAAAGVFDKYNCDLMPKGTVMKSNDIVHVDGGVHFYTDKK